MPHWRRAVPLVILLALAVSGCGPAVFLAGQDLRLQASGDTIYIIARSDGVSRSLCSSLGGDVARAEGRWAANEGRSIALGRVRGCHTVRHIIVCPEGDLGCVAHEERHRREGAFHP